MENLKIIRGQITLDIETGLYDSEASLSTLLFLVTQDLADKGFTIHSEEIEDVAGYKDGQLEKVK